MNNNHTPDLENVSLPINGVPVLLSEAKKSNWLKTAEKSQMLDVSLQSKVDKIKAALSALPTLSTAEAIAGYESTLKKTKQDISELCAERMEFTAILDAVKSNKMKFEKEASAALPPFENALLGVKKEKATADAKVKAKADEIAALRLSFANYVTQQRATIEAVIIRQVSTVFEVAVKAKKPIEEVEAYLAENAIKEKTIKHARYAAAAPVNITKEEAVAIMKEVWDTAPILPDTLISSYNSQIEEKFGTKESSYWLYYLSLKNAEDALALSASEAAAQVAAVNDNALNTQVANKLQAVSAPLVAIAEVKTRDIKCVWKLDMEDSEITALTVWAAFMANWAACKPHLRLKGAALMNLSAKQMAAALVAVKEDDERFDVGGIKFKMEEKL